MRLGFTIALLFWCSAIVDADQPATLISNGGSGFQAPANTEIPKRQPIAFPARQKIEEVEQKEASRGPLVTVTSSLAIVLGLFCGFVWLSRKTSNARAGSLSKDVFEVLGTSQIDPRHQTALVKCGPRVLLVSLTGAGAATLTEFTDPDEVNALIAKVQPNAKSSFAASLKEAGDERSAAGFLDEPMQERHGLFSRGVQ